mgnify:CR=1 FL=1
MKLLVIHIPRLNVDEEESLTRFKGRCEAIYNICVSKACRIVRDDQYSIARVIRVRDYGDTYSLIKELKRYGPFFLHIEIGVK